MQSTHHFSAAFRSPETSDERARASEIEARRGASLEEVEMRAE